MANTNFGFLHTEWPRISEQAQEAEMLTFISPKSCAVSCRSALELAVNWLYDHDSYLQIPYRKDLSALIHEPSFKDILKPGMFHEVNLIRKLGNNGAHGTKVSPQEALTSLKALYRFTRFLVSYYAEERPHIPAFEEAYIPEGRVEREHHDALQRKVVEQERELARLRSERERLEAAAEEEQAVREQLEARYSTIQERKKTREQSLDPEEAAPHILDEKETRKRFIDISLKEAGWTEFEEGYNIEYEVRGMPASTNPTGIGYVDYVLWGDDGRPLAVIEAKKTLVDERSGRHQASLYADCLEQMKGQRPVIFYSNGFSTHIWEDRFGPPRRVAGFYTKDELQLMMDRRQSRRDLTSFQPDMEIAGRKYQLEAIQRVAETFTARTPEGRLTQDRRHALLVMATGSGKTRTAAAIVDMLAKCNWVKRVLFLADRNALVSQAKNAFAEYLPELSGIDLTKEREDVGTRLVFSTYPTIMNKIDKVRDDDGRFYGPGHFDLIIIDEAHRSVYQKYRAIFEYFDSLLIGLTATPKKDIDHNTYSLFEIEDDDPTAAYELEEAVADGFLVPPKAMSVPLKFQREGVRYADLSAEEKEEYEEKFGDPTTGEAPEEIGSSALNQWLFNSDTVDKVLVHLMENGVKVQGGDKLGKTIIFAKNHMHAIFIQERFDKLFPEYRGSFLRVIDNYESKAEDLLDRFKDPLKEVDPQIAVSVDMMDTGVDAPRVVNLVFFKLVRSQSKFWQMVGRGTRLCPDLYGPGEDKTHFLIFDYCQNLEFFESNPDGIESSHSKSLTQRIFELKLDLMMAIRARELTTEAEDEQERALTEELHRTVETLNRERFMVKMALRHVVEFSDAERWESLNQGDASDIKEHISNLVLPYGDDEGARRWDVLLLSAQLALIEGKDLNPFITKVSLVGQELAKKGNIPSVGAQMHIIRAVRTDVFWNGVNVKRLEEVRIALRELIKFIDKEEQQIVYTDLKDELREAEEKPLLDIRTSLRTYRERVESFIREHSDHITISKLKGNEPITMEEVEELERILFDGKERGTKEDYYKEFGDKPLGTFIRSIVGMDKDAANQAFSDFLQAGPFTADQMNFLNSIIQHLTVNGTIDPSMLFESPFTHMHDQGLMGVFDDAQSTKVIRIIRDLNDRAAVG